MIHMRPFTCARAVLCLCNGLALLMKLRGRTIKFCEILGSHGLATETIL